MNEILTTITATVAVVAGCWAFCGVLGLVVHTLRFGYPVDMRAPLRIIFAATLTAVLLSAIGGPLFLLASFICQDHEP